MNLDSLNVKFIWLWTFKNADCPSSFAFLNFGINYFFLQFTISFGRSADIPLSFPFSVFVFAITNSLSEFHRNRAMIGVGLFLGRIEPMQWILWNSMVFTSLISSSFCINPTNTSCGARRFSDPFKAKVFSTLVHFHVKIFIPQCFNLSLKLPLHPRCFFLKILLLHAFNFGVHKKHSFIQHL